MAAPEDLGDETPALDTAVVQALQGVVGTPASDIAREAKRDAVLDGLGLSEPGSARRLGRYVVVGVLGRGGMGTVLEAHDEQADRRVAIKLLHSGSAEHHVQRLRAEAQALASFDHPNVVEVFEVGEAEGQAFVAMQRLDGVTLATWQTEAARGWRACVEVYLQAGRGLSAAHEAGLVHQDFKPANCIIDGRQRVRVLDFGLARRIEGAAETHAYALGTPGYMAPELFDGAAADARSDQFSFCVALYEALYGRRPFTGGSLEAVIAATRKGVVEAGRVSVEVPASLRAIIVRGLEADPQRRWPSMSVLLEQLERCLAPGARRWLTPGLVAGMAVVAIGLGLAAGDDAEQRARAGCARAAEEGLDAVWSEQRGRKVATALSATGLPYAEDTAQRVVPRLGAYAERWAEAHRQACEATQVRREQSERTLELRLRCLGDHAVALAATVETLADADEPVVREAMAVVTMLPPIETCDDATRLQRLDDAMPLPNEEARAQQVASLRERLVRLKVRSDVGHHAHVAQQLPSLMDDASALDHPPLLAEVQLWRGVCLGRSGDHEEAERQLRQAYATALEQGHEDIVLGAAARLTMVVGVHLQRHAEGLQWGRTALPLATRRGDPVARSVVERGLGRVFDHQGQHPKAEEHYRQALRSVQEAGPGHDLATATVLDALATVLERRGEHGEALERRREALGLRERILGPRHPEVLQARRQWEHTAR
ncbi:MAG: serine/threonine-protein kinase [Myxococcota bacterium]